MSTQTYLIDTNVIIGLEDNHAVQPGFAALTSIAAKHKVDILVHEAARDDIQRDRDVTRRNISLSKLEKFQLVRKVRGLEQSELERRFGRLARPNDVVDATLLDCIERGAADFLVTEDGGLHERARRVSASSSDASCLSRTRCSYSRRPTNPSKPRSAMSRKLLLMKFS